MTASWRRFAEALLACLLVLWAVAADAAGPSRAKRVADLITELDVEGARKLLSEQKTDTPTLAFERARLAIYMGDCDSAVATLSAPILAETPEGASLGELARRCAQGTAAGFVVEDKARGVWIRLQDDADRVLIPYLVRVADASRAAMARDLGVELPRPLRIDLVRDLFTLSALTGLPLRAAETTGTVAVARWGRVTMLSPRATPLGYPWEDTLAHEIAHLALSRATRDRAPLWLQEGIAKRQEGRWRSPRPFDGVPDHDRVARTALQTGTSIGVDQLGPSIAMLPTAEAASTAFSEVTSFMSYWIEQNGTPALHLLLMDLKGLGADDPEGALRSVTGYGLKAWIRMWQEHLLAHDDDKAPPKAASAEADPTFDVGRAVRLGDLLWARGHAGAAQKAYEPALKALPREAAIRWRAARAALGAGEPEAAKSALGQLTDIDILHGAWSALDGRFARDRGDGQAADKAFALGVAVDPLAVDVACEGHWERPASGADAAPLHAPADPERRALCDEARKIPRD